MSNETKILVGIGAVTVILVVGAALMFGGKSSSAKDAQPIKNPEVLVRKDSHVKKATVKPSVTLVEFGDFQCPACGAAYPTVTQILDENKGKINFVFRQFPLQMHPNSHPAAEAAEAAGAQGKFFEMYNLLYTNQDKWGESKDPMPYFIAYAKGLKLNVDQFQKDIKSKKYAKKIQKDIDDGYAASVQATPTFFVNGVPLTGGATDLKKKIEEQLKN